MEVYESLIDVVGNTPLVRLRSVAAAVPAPVLAKIEYLNPGGSVKDRIALRMIEAAEASGELKQGGTIVEPTSGNTGVGLAIAAASRGYDCVFVVPDKVAADKINVLRAYGAGCSRPTAVAPEDPRPLPVPTGSSEISGRGSDQYANENNPRSHYEQGRNLTPTSYVYALFAAS